MTDESRSTSPAWAVTCEMREPLRQTDDAPGMEAMPPFPKNIFRFGEHFDFAVDVVAEPTSSQGKRGFLFPSTPARNTFEVHCDEGTAFGGKDSAPSPLSYLTSAVAFCLLSHMTGYLHQIPLRINRMKVEIRGNFWTVLPKDGDVTNVGGGCNAFECFFIIDSDEAPEKIEAFVETCRQSCIALQTIANPVATNAHVIHNGTELPAPQPVSN